MKKIILIHALTMWCMVIFSQVNFQDIPFNEALKKAQSENKYVFVDCYTSWCGPCKHMTENIFPQQKVGDYFNAKFVCVKYDMEKGEGPELAKKYEVRAYPTFLILKADGSLLHQVIGSHDADNIIKKVEESFFDTKAFGNLKARYENGERNKDFLKSYLQMLIVFYNPEADLVSNELLQLLTPEEKTSPDYWFIFSNGDLTPKGSNNEKFLVSNYKDFYRGIGEVQVAEELNKRYNNILIEIIQGKDSILSIKDIRKIGKLVNKMNLKDKNEFQSYIQIALARKEGDLDRIIDVCSVEFDKLPVPMVPYVYLFDDIMKMGNREQKVKWLSIMENLASRNKDEKSLSFMNACIDYFKERL